MQVQLAKPYDHKYLEKFRGMGFYSRKFDGKRMYYLDDIAYSRDNKICRPAPISHITAQISTCLELRDYVTDGEVLYFNEDYSENFKKAISLTSRIERSPECERLYYVIFDIIHDDFFRVEEDSENPFSEEYAMLLQKLEAQEIEGRCDLLKTKLPNVYIAKQSDDLFKFTNHPQYKDWEGLMLRDAGAPYQYKRTDKLLKIKQWQDIECKVVGVKAGIGKHLGRLGALIVDYKGYVVAVGSGFNDQEREILWRELKEGGRLYDSLVNGELYIKVKYFEESQDADGNISLRFPTYLCFRDTNLGEFVL